MKRFFVKRPVDGCIVHVVLNNHFAEHGGVHRSAIVTEVLNSKDGTIYAEVFLTPKDRLIISANNPYSMLCRYSDTKEPGTWHWIEKV